MNDRFKFRAWNKKLNRWIDDFQLMDFGAMRFLLPLEESPQRLEWQSVDEEKYILMQCSGLKDKNGKLIYEGDIVKWDDSSGGKYWRVAVVELFPALQFRIIKNSLHELSCEVDNIFGYANFIYQDTNNWLEIVGNIYENPEITKDFSPLDPLKE